MSWEVLYRIALRAYPSGSRSRWTEEILATARQNVADNGRGTHARELVAILREGLAARSRREVHLTCALATGLSWLAVPMALVFAALSTSAALHFVAADRSLNLGLWWATTLLTTWLGFALLVIGRRRLASCVLAVFAVLLAYDTWGSMLGLTMRIDSPHVGRAHGVGYGGPDMAGFLVPAAIVMLLSALQRREASPTRWSIGIGLVLPIVIALATFVAAPAMSAVLFVGSFALIGACVVATADPRAAGAVLGLWAALVPFVFWPLADVAEPLTLPRIAMFFVYVSLAPSLVSGAALLLRRRARNIA